MERFQNEPNKDEISAEYGSLLCSLLLANEFNPECNKALRNTAKIVRRRVQSQYVKDICTHVMTAKQVSPLKWLETRLREVENLMPVCDFLSFTRQKAFQT